MSSLNVKILSTFILRSQSLQDTWMKEANGTKSHIFKEARLNGIYNQMCGQASRGFSPPAPGLILPFM